MTGLAINIYDGPVKVCDFEPLNCRVELGRYAPATATPSELFHRYHKAAGVDRIHIACDKETAISREQVTLDPLSDGSLAVENISKTTHIDVGGTLLPPAGRLVVRAGSVIRMANKRVEVFSSGMVGLSEPSLVPGQDPLLSSISGVAANATWSGDFVIRCFQAISTMMQSAKTAHDFYQLAVRAMLELLGLDSARVLLYEAGQWKDALPVRYAHAPSQRVLRWMFENRDTCWQLPQVSEQPGSNDESLSNVGAVVAAPILNTEGNVCGALYGDRRQAGTRFAQSIDRPAALLVKTLADALSVGLDRLQKQRAALLFEQFFTADLAQHLAAEPTLLEGRDAEVTLLFCDIRGFSRVSNRLKDRPAVMVQWLGEVMTALSDCVLAEDGVLVDYIGDELMAMWGAPAPQADHAERACRAALRMVAEVDRLSPLWAERIGESFGVGVGINSGDAFVGNTGSQQKFKYGPLGDCVNIASRVQGATKHFGCPVLITQATQKRLNQPIPIRRLRQVRVVNIPDPITLYEVPVSNGEPWQSLCRQYETALDQFEQAQFGKSIAQLITLADEFPKNPSVELLYDHATDAYKKPQEAKVIWDLPSK